METQAKAEVLQAEEKVVKAEKKFAQAKAEFIQAEERVVQAEERVAQAKAQVDGAEERVAQAFFLLKKGMPEMSRICVLQTEFLAMHELLSTLHKAELSMHKRLLR